MANKQAKFTYKGLNQDITKSKHPFEFYYDAKNIRIINTDSQDSYSISNEKGNEKVIELPDISIDNNKILYNNKEIIFSNSELENYNIINNNHIIIGHTTTRNSIILFSTNNEGLDCIWEVKELLEGNFKLELLYLRNLNFNINNPIQILYNYENDKIEKLYWADGLNQLRHINLRHSILNGDIENLIDLNSTNIDVVSKFKISNITISDITQGGLHTSGMIQYSYNLYRLNGSQTKLTPLTQLIPLNKGDINGGGSVNEIVGASPNINIENIDSNYTHIKIYAIKYTSFNELPNISLIYDQEIPTTLKINYTDDGSKIKDISSSEFLFLGSEPKSPKHITSKDNILFSANIRDLSFDIDFDTRAYSFNSSSQCNIILNDHESPILLPNEFLDVSIKEYGLKYDMINPDLDIYTFQQNGVTYGGTGKFISYNTTPINKNNSNSKKLFKSLENYRIGIEFYNELGQFTPAKWISDFKTPFCNLDNTNSNLEININIEGINLLKSKGIKGFRILRVERNEANKTIVCQGLLSGMMVFDTRDPSNYQYYNSPANLKEAVTSQNKMPNFLLRHFNDLLPLKSYFHQGRMNYENRTSFTEIYADKWVNLKQSHSFQYNKMMQLYSPELLFGNINFSNNMKIRTLGLSKVTYQECWAKSIDTRDKTTLVETRIKNGIGTVQVLQDPSVTHTGNLEGLMDYGMIGPAGSYENEMDFYQYYREYYNKNNNNFIKSNSPFNYITHSIYGIPETTERGQGRKLYNNDSLFPYTNNLQSVISDTVRDDADTVYITNSGNTNIKNRNDKLPGVITSNSYGEKCLTLVLGQKGDAENRKSIKNLYNDLNISETDGVIISDIVRVLSNQYGGNSYETKGRNTYLKIGDYYNLDDKSMNITIDNHGDTYASKFNFLRINKTDNEIYEFRNFQLTEVVSVLVETSIDLENRNDISLSAWDGKFQPRSDEYHEYNKVYSQESNLLQNSSLNFKFKKNDLFNTRVQSSKIKVPGEIIDNWTDYLENEVLDLDGKYGAINNLITWNDKVFSLQDEAISFISINPRVQTQGNDGISIELGKGGILYDYNYISTYTGTINKWSVTNSPSGFFYYDLYNKSFNKCNGSSIINLSETKGMHQFFQNNSNFEKLKLDNPIIKSGISSGYDMINKQVYLTFLQDKNNKTITFNDKLGYFDSFWDFYPSRYINKGFELLTPSNTNNNLYSHFKGNYNMYYDEYKPSYITLQLNPESDLDCIFDNIEFNSEIYLNDIDQPDKTFTHIQAYNEYQNSGKIPLILGRNKNLKRKFRKWRANIPRDGRNRIRNPWIFLKLELDNISNYKLILHDIILNYTTP